MNLMLMCLGAFLLTLFSSVLVWVVALVGLLTLCLRQWKAAAWIVGVLLAMWLSHVVWFMVLVSVIALLFRRRDVAACAVFMLLGALLAPLAGTPHVTALFVTFVGMCFLGGYRWLTEPRSAPTV